jgi:ribonuclease Z
MIVSAARAPGRSRKLAVQESAFLMSINFRVLGAAGSDNALFVQVDSGQAVERLLFDCGDGCLSQLSFGEIQAIDHLLFSHLHMDHVGGFDSFFRCTFDRNTKPNQIWGPGTDPSDRTRRPA